MPHFVPTPLRRLLLAGLLLAVAPAAQAKIWRVDNNGGSPGNFTTAQAAHDGASANDTLYFNGSGTSYGSLTMTKRLYVFGPGYFLAQNPETQASTNTAQLSTLQVNADASGSLVTGMEMSRAYLYASNFLFKRNHVTYTTSDFIVQVGDGGGNVPSNVLVVQNYVENNYAYGYAYYGALRVYPGCSNVIVTNNLLYHYGLYGCGRALWAQTSVSCAQNVLHGELVTESSSVVNNISYGGCTVGGSGNSYYNNIGDGTQFPTGNGNQQSQPFATVFVGSGSSDGQYQLAVGSPAIGAGQNGEDVGMYGGIDPYVLSGLPAIPAIWYFSAPSSGSNASGLQVRLKAKSHN